MRRGKWHVEYAFEHHPDVEGQQRAWPFFLQPQGSELMPQTGLGVALKTLRERRTLSLREIGQLSSVDHAYVMSTASKQARRQTHPKTWLRSC